MFTMLLALCLASPARAEDWPTLDAYVRSVTLIVHATAQRHGDRWAFRVDEAWKGTFDPSLFTETTPDGRFFAAQGEHGVQVVEGQPIVFFFGPHGQPVPGRYARHSTAFPVRDGSIRYAETAEPGGDTTYTVSAFEAAIRAVD